MKCFKCGNDISLNYDICPYCGTNKNIMFENSQNIKVKSVKKISSIISLLISGTIFSVISFAVISALSVLGYIKLANIILKTIFYVGLVIFIINVLIFIKRKGEELNASHNYSITNNKKRGFSIIWLIVSIFLMIYPYGIRIARKAIFNLDDIDYSKALYIEISNVKIPSLYSVVGERDISFNIGFNNIYDEDTDKKYDMFTIVYDDLTDQDINNYKNELIKQGYIKIELSQDSLETNSYAKNDITKNIFIIVSISDDEFEYCVSNGRYEEMLRT